MSSAFAAQLFHPRSRDLSRDTDERRQETLDLDCARLTTVPDDVLRFRSLRVLNLSGNHIECPPWMALRSLASLQELNLSTNRITVLPLELAGWDSLTCLDVSYNRIESFAPRLWSLLFPTELARTFTFEGQVIEHSASLTARLERVYPKRVPATIWWNTASPEEYPTCRECTIGPKVWRLYDKPGIAPRVRLEGNERLMRNQPYLANRREWAAMALQWRARYEKCADAPQEEEEEEEAPAVARPQWEPERRKDAIVRQEELRRKSAAGETARKRRRVQRMRAISTGFERQTKWSV